MDAIFDYRKEGCIVFVIIQTVNAQWGSGARERKYAHGGKRLMSQVGLFCYCTNSQEGKFPLHLAVAHNASAEVIAALLQAHPKAALMPDQVLMSL
jgi:hypothetical protein